jgi:hypothetical protein
MRLKREVHDLIAQGVKKTPACNKVAKRRNKTPRAIEKAYEKHNFEMQRIMGEARKGVERAIERSKLLRKGFAPDET